jgi:FkbM family methyltransferase
MNRMKILIWMYRTIFCRKFFYSFNLRVFNLSLRGIGILNYEGYAASGEAWFLHSFLKDKNVKIIIDVGANIHPYGMELPSVQVFALEPNKKSFTQLRKNTKNHGNIRCFPIGLSNKKGKATLYDISNDGSELATLSKGNLKKLWDVKLTESQITLTTLDEFVEKQKIHSIDLLKIDTEGNEYNVLLGAKKTLSKKKIKMILFEINQMNAYNRVFLRDFMELLKGFAFYRLLPDGIVSLEPYLPITHELFAFQNIVAIRKD